MRFSYSVIELVWGLCFRDKTWNVLGGKTKLTRIEEIFGQSSSSYSVVIIWIGAWYIYPIPHAMF